MSLELHAQCIGELLQVRTTFVNATSIPMHIVRRQEKPSAISLVHQEKLSINAVNVVKELMRPQTLKQFLKLLVRSDALKLEELFELFPEFCRHLRCHDYT